MNTKAIGYAIGSASTIFGLTDILFGDKFAGIVGSKQRGATLFKLVGAREVATGVASLIAPHSAAPVWTRFAADVVDLAALSIVAAKPDNAKRKAAVATLALVAGVALIDFLAARKLSAARAAD